MESAENIEAYVKQATQFVRTKIRDTVNWSSGQIPAHGIVLGSGLGSLAHRVENATILNFKDIPNFPRSTVTGHSGQLIVGTLDGIAVAMLAGRAHLYEGYAPWQTGFGVRLLHRLGVQTLFLSNAAGALHDGLHPGDLMLITDHINLIGKNPLTGAHYKGWGERFIDMSTAYSPRLTQVMGSAAADINIKLKRGIYLATHGPSYETAAEVRMMRSLGGDAVGMSTVPEVIVAAQCRLDVCAISLITNYGTGVGSTDDRDNEGLSHSEVTAMAAEQAAVFEKLVLAFLKKMG